MVFLFLAGIGRGYRAGLAADRFPMGDRIRLFLHGNTCPDSIKYRYIVLSGMYMQTR